MYRTQLFKSFFSFQIQYLHNIIATVTHYCQAFDQYLSWNSRKAALSWTYAT